MAAREELMRGAAVKGVLPDTIITAVYADIPTRQPLRFVLADDAEAGMTIMDARSTERLTA